MKRQTFGALAIFGLLLMLAVQSISAKAQPSVKVRIPFEFYGGSAKLPAGVYTVKHASNGSPVFILANENSNDTAMVMTHASVRDHTERRLPRLVFNRYGDTYFLTQVWSPFSPDCSQLPMSKRERALRRELAMGNTQPNQVALVIGQH